MASVVRYGLLTASAVALAAARTTPHFSNKLLAMYSIHSVPFGAAAWPFAMVFFLHFLL
jgi:hypothetical protein